MTFAALHSGDSPLLLPNAWDVGSALAFEAAGYVAIGTTSFGVAAAAGTPDGGRSSRAATARLVTAISALPVYVSADIEDGYSDSPDEVAEFVASLDVAGINIEDSTAEKLVDPAAYAAKVAAIKRAAPDVFVNARIDNFWLGQYAEVDGVVDRARRYLDAGADGVFLPGLTDPDGIAAITAAVPVPVNLLAHPTLSLAQLYELGVRRVSSGSLPYRAALDRAVEVADALRDGGVAAPATPYAQLQDRLTRFTPRLTR